MANVRSLSGNPIAADFANDDGTPIVVDRTSGNERLFILNAAGDVVEMVAAVPYGVRVALGNVTGTTVLRKFGENRAVGTSDTYIGGPGGTAPYMPTSATLIEIVSDSASDDAAASNARSLTVIGLNSAFSEITEVINLGGTAPVTSSASFIRVYRAYVETCGTYGGANAGLITVRAVGGGTTFVTIATANGQTQETSYCVPAGFKLLLSHFIVTPDSNKAVTVKFKIREAADDTTAPVESVRVISEFPGVVAPDQFSVEDTPVAIAGKTDVWVTGVVTTGSGSVAAEYYGFLIADD